MIVAVWVNCRKPELATNAGGLTATNSLSVPMASAAPQGLRLVFDPANVVHVVIEGRVTRFVVVRTEVEFQPRTWPSGLELVMYV